jgi:hypothetical protein
MTIFSLGNACDLEHFTGNTKLENFDMPQMNSPIMPMPTDPPFGNTKYQWKSDGAVARDMTTRMSLGGSNQASYQPEVDQYSREFGSFQNYGNDYWGGGNTVNYEYDNKLLNAPNSMQGMQAEPGMRQQNVHMPPMRTENMEKKPVEVMKKKIIEIVTLPYFPKDKMKSDQKNVWIALIILFIVVGFIVMHKTKML